jgi:hypothetical protein
VNDVATLWYADSRRIVRSLRSIVRNPLRALGWIFFVLYFGLMFSLRRDRSVFPALHEPYATAIAAGILAFAGFALWGSAKTQRVRGCAEPAETLFLSRSAIAEPLVAAWIYGRYFLATYGRSIIAMLFLGLFYRRSGIGAIAGFAGLLLAIEMAKIPIAYAARRFRWIPRACLALSIGALMLLAIDMLPLLVTPMQPLRVFALDLHLGRALIALWHGRPGALASVYGGAMLLAFIGWRSARDIYPEFYASASFYQSVRMRVREGRAFSMNAAHGASSRQSPSGATRLGGPWVEIWKQAAFLRRRNGTKIVAIGLTAGAVLGGIAGFAQRASHGLGFAILFTLGMLCAIMLAAGSVSLARDIAKPLWWMGEGSLFSKLFAWTVGSALAPIVFLATAIAVAWVISPSTSFAAVLACAIVLPVALRGIATLCYAALPNAIDQRGPGFLLRLLIIYAAIGIALGAGLVIGLVFQSVSLGTVAGIAAFVIEGLAATAFAAALIAGRGVTYAAAESN